MTGWDDAAAVADRPDQQRRGATMRPYGCEPGETHQGRYLVGPEDDPREVRLFPNADKTVTLVARPDADNVPVALTAGEAREMARLLIEAADEVEREP